MDLNTLLDQAVPPIPQHLDQPPYRQIRRRHRRRHTAAVVTVSLAVAAVVAGSTVALTSAWPGGRGTTVAEDTTPPPAVIEGWHVLGARVDRAGTGLTLYVNPSVDLCLIYPDVVATADEGPDAVVVTVTGQGSVTDCQSLTATEVRLALEQPLGARDLRGNPPLADGRQISIRPFFDADLPQVPAPWSEEEVRYADMDGTLHSYTYNRPDGPALLIHATTHSLGPVTPVQPHDEVSLGSREGVLVESSGMHGVKWRVRDLTYVLLVGYRDGDALRSSVDDVRSVISQLTWP